MEEIIINIIDSFGYIGIFLLVALENIFPPIPSEIILTFGGFLTTYTSMNITYVIVSSTIGSVFGAVILYMVGRFLNRDRLKYLINNNKFIKILRLKEEDLDKSEKWFNRHGSKAVLLCRFVPIVRSLISIPAGSAKMKLYKFIPLTFIGTLIWNSILIYLGSIAQNAWKEIPKYMSFYSIITLFIIFAIAGICIYKLFKKREYLEDIM